MSNDPPPPPAASTAKTVLLVILGILFILGWIAAHLVWGTMSLMAGAMANDSGLAQTDTHANMILGMICGQVVAGAAGIPAGLSFFWRGQRKKLLIAFAALFVAGALWQVLAFTSFIYSIPTPP